MLLTYSKMCNQFTEQRKKSRERQQTVIRVTQLLSVSIVQTNKQTHTSMSIDAQEEEEKMKRFHAKKANDQDSKLLLPRSNVNAWLSLA